MLTDCVTLLLSNKETLIVVGRQELDVPRTKVVSSERAFEEAAQKAWNKLPVDITTRQPETLECSRGSSRLSYSALHTPYLANKQTIVYHRHCVSHVTSIPRDTCKGLLVIL